MANYANKRYRYVYSLKDMQTIYNIASQYTTIIKTNSEYKFTQGQPTMRIMSVVNDGDRYYKITTMYVVDVENKDGTVSYVDIFKTNEKKYVCTWIFDKTDTETFHVHPSIVSKRSNAVYKPFNIVKDPELGKIFDKTKDGKIFQSAKPIIGFNPKYDNTEHNVVCYDINTAYGHPLMKQIPDTYNMKTGKRVGKGEVGFMLDADLTMVDEGMYADFVFPLIDSPYKEYIQKWYDIKRYSPKGSKEKIEAKQTLVITVGLWQNSNPFLRAYVVQKCNRKINLLRAKYGDKICAWNTDSVYATEHLTLIDENLIGDEIGQFKIEYEGKFRQKGNNYQKVDIGETTYRGVLKSSFGKDWNILTDGLPTYVLPYRMNSETYMLEKNPNYKGE